MAAIAKQASFGGLDTETNTAKATEAAYTWREQLWSAMRLFVETYVDLENGLKKYEGCAFRLNKIWEEKGRPVTAGALKQALTDADRNNFRLEWADWFASQDSEVAALLGRRVKPQQTKDEYIAALEAEVRDTLSHRQAEALLKRARSR
jgi:hypothetical protein